jgi:hypothetical protein
MKLSDAGVAAYRPDFYACFEYCIYIYYCMYE